MGDNLEHSSSTDKKSKQISLPVLDRLCDQLGILKSYRDGSGKEIFASPEQKLQLIAALGYIDKTKVHVPTIAQSFSDIESLAEDILSTVEHEEWTTPLESFQTFMERESPYEMSINIPMSLPRNDLHYTLTLEGGGFAEGKLSISHEPYLKTVIDKTEYGRFKFTIPQFLSTGYHTLVVKNIQSKEEWNSTLLIAPDKVYVAPDGEIAHRYGLAVQLYALHSKRTLGVGDLGDLRELFSWSKGRRITLIGVNPLHALAFANPAHCQPYSPFSRLYLNPMILEIQHIPEFLEAQKARELLSSKEYQTWIENDRKSDRIDYAETGKRKRALLELLFEHFEEVHLHQDSARGKMFKKFVESEGESLERQASFDALYEHFFESKGITNFREWPEEYRTPNTRHVKEFAKEKRSRINFYCYLQWNTREQITTLSRLAGNHNVSIYLDLAVGVIGSGSEVWSNPSLYAEGVSIGAPPDGFSPLGQSWGLAPFHPRELKKQNYAPFIELLRKNMLEGGVLRMDHALSLFRLYWVTGNDARQGGYLQYPSKDILNIISIESHRHKCMLIGEDLGTVPHEVKETLMDRAVFSWKVLYFEKDYNGEFLSPDKYPVSSVATLNTHDLPTLAGWWSGEDIRLRNKLSLFPKEGIEERIQNEFATRSEDKKKLLKHLHRFYMIDKSILENPPEKLPHEIAVAVHTLLAGVASKFILVSVNDLIGEDRQPNMPGTVDQYPNWKLRYTLSIDEMKSNRLVVDILQIIQRRYTS